MANRIKHVATAMIVLPKKTIFVCAFYSPLYESKTNELQHGLCKLLYEEEEKMTLFDFKLLPQREQLDLLYEQGVYIGKRKQGETTILLYQQESFYVEIFYSKYRCHVLAIRSFIAMHGLDPYLCQVDVADLVNI